MKRLLVICLIGLTPWLVPAGIAQAGHIDLPVKWSQLPDMGTTAVDIRAEHITVGMPGQVVADDWMCTSPLPVVAVRWWGSYLTDPGQVQPIDADGDGIPDTPLPRMLPFEISWHLDGPSDPFSQPGDPLFLHDFIMAQEHYFGRDQAGNNVYEYNAFLPDPWEQHLGETYWIDIELNVTALGWPYQTWGWHNTDDPWRDQAVISPGPAGSHFGPWQKIDEDMAFELMVVPVPGAVLLAMIGLGAVGVKLRKSA